MGGVDRTLANNCAERLTHKKNTQDKRLILIKFWSLSPRVNWPIPVVKKKIHLSEKRQEVTLGIPANNSPCTEYLRGPDGDLEGELRACWSGRNITRKWGSAMDRNTLFDSEHSVEFSGTEKINNLPGQAIWQKVRETLATVLNLSLIHI